MTNARSLNKYDLFEKRNERKNSKVTRKTISPGRRKSMFWGNYGCLQRITKASKRV